MIIALLYKFQGNLFFLMNFVHDLSLIMKQKEPNDNHASNLFLKRKMLSYFGMTEEQVSANWGSDSSLVGRASSRGLISNASEA